MSHDSYLCGFIKVKDIEMALKAIGELPSNSDADTWPFLTSEMFSFTSSPMYRDNIIHFAASYKDIWGSWQEWEIKFESLLAQISYDGIKIIVEDCYQGDFLVAWVCEYKDGQPYINKIRKKLNYENKPDINFV